MSRRDERLDERLDDELRNAFRREQPSTDFTMKLLERVADKPAPRLSLWQQFAVLLEPPKIRWAAIGIAASVLLAVGAMQYNTSHRKAVSDSGAVAIIDPSTVASSKGSTSTGVDPGGQEAVTNKPAPIIKRDARSATNHRALSVQHQQEQNLRAEGEAAKEKLMLALAIASSALSDAQKAVHDDGLQP